jgi:hypothetical protein
MQESESSLRWLFATAGTISLLLLILQQMFPEANILGVEIWPQGSISPSGQLGLALDVAYMVGNLFFAFTLPMFLSRGRLWVVWIFLVGPVLELIVTDCIVFGTTGEFSVVPLAISTSVSWYLFQNINRLSSKIRDDVVRA